MFFLNFQSSYGQWKKYWLVGTNKFSYLFLIKHLNLNFKKIIWYIHYDLIYLGDILFKLNFMHFFKISLNINKP